MPDWLKLILAVLACYRLADLITLDEGPASIFHRIRLLSGAYDYDSQGRAKTNLGRAMGCPYCIGIWIAAPLAIWLGGIEWYSLLWWLAIAGGQAFLQGFSR